ncbi:MAG TPA: mechanosensitive ion channel domain-containing protein, partial [Brevundimonas sp.]|nr:mechanosensitive ion channel domain-containing protein [Brevundimonas sp.]
MSFLHETLTQTVAAGEKRLTVDAAILAKVADMAGDLAINLTIAALIFVVTLFVARWASGVTRRVLGRMRAFRHDQTVLSFAAQVVRVVIIIIGLIAVLQRLGVQTTSIIAVLGAASLAVGLALQGTLSNVAAGVMLLVLRPYRVGEVIDVGGASGTVQKLDLFTTQLT